MSSIVPQQRWTAQMVRDLIDRQPGHWPRYEVIDGELLVSPGPTSAHQDAIKLLLYILDPYVKAHELGWVAFAPTDIRLDTDALVQPDLFVAHLVSGRRPGDDAPISSLLLAVEVRSPSTARYDRVTKRRRYQRAGVEYWVVDGDARTVERWWPHEERPEILTETLVWQPGAATPPLVIDLPAYFARVNDER